jgi:hypothetical protein
MTTTPAVNFVQSFRMYGPEHRPELIAFVKDWTRAKPATKVYQDRSVLKVTADEATINALRAECVAKFPGWTPAGIEGADDKKK